MEADMSELTTFEMTKRHRRFILPNVSELQQIVDFFRVHRRVVDTGLKVSHAFYVTAWWRPAAT